MTREFDSIADKFTALNDDVARGKMMNSPGLKCNGKVFAFHCKDGMGFRLGQGFDAQAFGLENPRLLSPFKTKGPLKGWYVVDEEQIEKWQPLAELALTFTRTL